MTILRRNYKKKKLDAPEEVFFIHSGFLLHPQQRLTVTLGCGGLLDSHSVNFLTVNDEAFMVLLLPELQYR